MRLRGTVRTGENSLQIVCLALLRDRLPYNVFVVFFDFTTNMTFPWRTGGVELTVEALCVTLQANCGKTQRTKSSSEAQLRRTRNPPHPHYIDH